MLRKNDMSKVRALAGAPNIHGKFLEEDHARKPTRKDKRRPRCGNKNATATEETLEPERISDKEKLEPEQNKRITSQ